MEAVSGYHEVLARFIALPVETRATYRQYYDMSLRTVTTAPAAYLGRVDRMGAVAPGMDADFLLLAAATV